MSFNGVQCLFCGAPEPPIRLLPTPWHGLLRLLGSLLGVLFLSLFAVHCRLRVFFDIVGPKPPGAASGGQIQTFGNLKAIWGKNPTTGWKETHDRVETHLRQLKMKNRFFKKNFPILSKKLKLLRKVKVFRPSVTHFFENLIIRGSV